MTIVTDRTYRDERVIIDDGTEFRRCRFENCEIVITGDADLHFYDCASKSDCVILFEARSERILDTLSMLYRWFGGASGPIEQVLETIRQGGTAKPP
jgi:hypothetical protein